MAHHEKLEEMRLYFAKKTDALNRMLACLDPALFGLQQGAARYFWPLITTLASRITTWMAT